MSIYDSIPLLPPDPIFGIGTAYQADKRREKLTLVTGYYRDARLQVPLLRSVMRAEQEIVSSKLVRHYLPIGGDPELVQCIGELVFGDLFSPEITCGFQTVGGTGALCLCGKLLGQSLDQIAIPNHTWANHWNIFEDSGMQLLSYPYYRDKQLLFHQMMAEFNEYPNGTAILLHANGQNPTGVDLSQEQWEAVAEVAIEKKLYPIIDMAYQGFSKQPDEDAFGPRLFMEKGIEFALTYTCSKSFSVYGERIGALYFVVRDSKLMKHVDSQIQVMVRQMYSEPPSHGSEIIKRILKNKELTSLWLSDLSEMRLRMEQIRKDFGVLMVERDPGKGWEIIRQGTGLFCFLELTDTAVERLRIEKGIYVTSGGR